MLEELKRRLMDMDEEERCRALELLIEVVDFVKDYPGSH